MSDVTTISVLAKELGVYDLPIKARLAFAKALQNEMASNFIEAEKYLATAIKEEQAFKNK